MLSVISRIMMFYETDVLEIKCDFFLSNYRPSCQKRLTMALVAIYQQKESARIKKPLVFTCVAFDVRFNTMGMHPPPKKRARGDEVGISRVEV